ncbi:hypothetical protein AAFN86_09515 [Roseomonas sp. CAU 1739]|uniref:hypothetical protein n=1 Tax=Roseomonas sp. CAU 1739 TaxID=3140364 RepID=UPI00325A8B33
MLLHLIRIGAVLITIAVVGEFVTPPLSCWVTKGFGSVEPGSGGQFTLMQPGGGVGTVLRQLLVPPAQTSGPACRATLARAVGLG